MKGNDPKKQLAHMLSAVFKAWNGTAVLYGKQQQQRIGNRQRMTVTPVDKSAKFQLWDAIAA